MIKLMKGFEAEFWDE